MIVQPPEGLCMIHVVLLIGVIIFKLCHKNERVLSQDINILLTLQSSVTLMAVVRERRLRYYKFIILLLCSKYICLNNKSLN